MLVLSRGTNEQIIVDDLIRITILGVRGDTARIGIEAPARVTILCDNLSVGPHRPKDEIVPSG